MDYEERMKVAVIAGASKALKLKAMNPHESDDRILKMVSHQANEVVNNID